MADSAPVVHIGENSPEQIAYRLLQDVMVAERRTLTPGGANGKEPADRNYILNTYAECLRAVKAPYDRQ